MVVAIVISALLVFFAAVCLWGAWENGALQLTKTEAADARIPASFDGFTFAHVSDLHNAQFGEGQSRLAEVLAEAHADVIVVTGDVIDKRRPGMQNALDFFSAALRIAPVYYVTGNHEAVSREYPELARRLEAMGVVMLDDAAVTLERGGERILLAGVSDPVFVTDDASENTAVMRKKLAHLLEGEPDFCVLLSHRPELFAEYRAAGVGLALTGHAHGGQFRFPWGGGVIAPNQGLLPKYTQGLFREGESMMSVSRGLGNSSIPIRLFNRPEVVAVTLRSENGGAKRPVA